MPDDPYSLGDLASLTDVTPRTIRYYVAQGLLPSPEAAGPQTRYGERHLLRLRAIKRLQREHLPLAEIRSRLERMGDEEVRMLLEATTMPDPSRMDVLAFVRDRMTASGLQPRVAEARALYAPGAPDEFVPLTPAAAPAPASDPGPSVRVSPYPVLQPATPPRPVDRTTWERHAFGPDVEIHVRRPLDRYTNKRVEQLLRIARELFDTES